MESLVVGEDEERGVCSPSQEQAAVAGDGALCSFPLPGNLVWQEDKLRLCPTLLIGKGIGVKIALGPQLENLMQFCKYYLEFLMTATDFPVYFLKYKLTTEDAPESVSTVSYFEK